MVISLIKQNNLSKLLARYLAKSKWSNILTIMNNRYHSNFIQYCYFNLIALFIEHKQVKCIFKKYLDVFKDANVWHNEYKKSKRSKSKHFYFF